MSLLTLTSKSGLTHTPVLRHSRSADSLNNIRTACPSALTQCSNCITFSHCFLQKLMPFEVVQYAAIIHPPRIIKKSVSLYRPNDTFKNIYVVRSGSFKTYVSRRDGKEQITGFYFSGELLGLDGICAQQHNGYAVALENSSVCAIPFHLLETICQQNKALQHHLYCVMSNKIVRDASLLLLLGTMSAEQRVAAFLLDISQRYKTQGYSATEFTLRMSREEIGSYLGLKFETVSRVLSSFQKNKVVDTHSKHIRILNITVLGSV
ncbi:MAG: helix-turn-helix domain-containing protein [Burkholderiaceae bacterium]|nr:helix-turn-helix domain-containing protein [Burkholderiaceae bacterium]